MPNKNTVSEYSLNELIEWIKKAVAQGYTIPKAKAKLIKHGCKPTFVETAAQKVEDYLKNKSHKKAVIIISSSLIVIILLIASLVYIPKYLDKPLVCQDIECFKQAMIKCKPAEYYNEKQEASWFYEILNKQNNECFTQLTLLQIKEGELELAKLQGLSMQCHSPLGTTTLPSEDIKFCNGRLKEELQGVIIEKLHTQVIENLGAIDQSLNS